MARAHNAELVRRYFETWRSDGLEGFLALVPQDVEWHPFATGGRRLWGTDELRSFWQELVERGETVEAELSGAEALDEDNVLATGTLRRRSADGTASEQVAWLFSFRDGRLWRTSGHSSVAEAREAARFLHTERVTMSREGPHFEVSMRQEPGGRCVLELSGELDVGTADELTAAIRRAADSGWVLVDLSRLEFMDSSGLRALLEAARDSRERGWHLELRRGPAIVQRVIAMAGTERLLPFESA